MSIFPFISPELAAVNSDPVDLPLFREYAYDFKANALKLKDGKTYLVEGNEALQIWIYKALLTPRFRHVAYTKAYGSEIHTLLGQAVSRDILESELRRFIIEALMVNPYIVELNGFRIEFSLAGVTVYFDCTTVYGEMRQSYVYEGGV